MSRIVVEADKNGTYSHVGILKKWEENGMSSMRFRVSPNLRETLTA